MNAKWMGESPRSVLARLANDRRTKEAEQRLRAVGMSDGEWRYLLTRIAFLPNRHAALSQETDTERARRAQALAKKVRAVARNIDGDHDASRAKISFQLDFGRSIANARLSRSDVPLRELLELIASATEQPDDRPFNATSMPLTLTTRKGNEVRSWVVKEIHGLIKNALHTDRTTRAKNYETALLAGVVLAADLTPNDVAQLRRKERRRYHSDTAPKTR